MTNTCATTRRPPTEPPPSCAADQGIKGLSYRMNRIPVLAAAMFLLALPAHADIRATEVEKTYTISGTTGMALYESIGERGPRIRDGESSAIAKTDFDLKWGRDYRRDGNDCVLVAARSFLTITYTLPKPAENLAPDVAARWRVFIAGIRAHEAVHGEYITEMAQQIYDTTVGFRQPNDPDCKTIRAAIQAPLKAAFDRYKARNRAFEQSEMDTGGNIQQLILGLVNGQVQN
jgi:predicted secreted Zn-dependent protease